MTRHYPNFFISATAARILGVSFFCAVSRNVSLLKFDNFNVFQFPNRKVWVKCEWHPKFPYPMNWYVLSAGFYPFIQTEGGPIQQDRQILYHSLYMGRDPNTLAHNLSEFVRHNPSLEPELE